MSVARKSISRPGESLADPLCRAQCAYEGIEDQFQVRWRARKAIVSKAVLYSDLDEAEANNRYVHHAANALPKLVVAIKAHLVSGNQPTRQALEAALAAAEEVTP